MYMVLYPLATFYFLFYVYFEQDKAMLGWCGIAAVIVANLVIASYVRMAWNEDRDDPTNKTHKKATVVEKRTD
jgi:hypothetical protein